MPTDDSTKLARAAASPGASARQGASQAASRVAQAPSSIRQGLTARYQAARKSAGEAWEGAKRWEAQKEYDLYQRAQRPGLLRVKRGNGRGSSR
jgi:hypothetical protein